MSGLDRRSLIGALPLLPLAARSGRAQDAPRELRIGYQKNGILVVAKQRRVIEERLRSLGVEVRWIEFSFGPPLLEALNVGSVDFGTTGDAPPIFAQAAGANLLYVAQAPDGGSSSAILLPAGSPIRNLSELKGRRVAFAKASSAHNLTVAALEKAGLGYGDIRPVHLAPADAAAAFSRGSVDAWTIWDPYFAVAERGEGVRTLALSKEIAPQNSFYLGNRGFTERHPRVVRAVVDELSRVAAWSEANRGDVAALLAEGTGVEAGAMRRAVDRSAFRIEVGLTDAVAAEQQRVADRFHALGLIPKPIRVRDAVWAPPAA